MVESRRQIEELIAQWFPRPDVPASLLVTAPPIAPGGESTGAAQPSLGVSRSPAGVGAAVTCSKSGEGKSARLELLSLDRFSPGRVTYRSASSGS